MKLEINVNVSDTNNTLMCRQIENALMQRLAGLQRPSGSPVLCDIPAEAQKEVDRLLRQESPKPTAEPEPARGEYAQTLTEISALLAQILNTPSEKKLREMRDLVDRALYGLVVKAERSKEVAPEWDRNCLFYTDSRLAAMYFELPRSRWTGIFLGPDDIVPTALVNTQPGPASVRSALTSRLFQLGAVFPSMVAGVKES